jgi:putative hydrolase of the HAD superfamily
MIHAITIDFWNTVVDSSNGSARKAVRDRALARVFTECGRPWDDCAAEAALRHAYASFEDVWRNEHRTLDASACLQIVWEQLDLAPARTLHAETVTAFEDSILHGLPAMLPGAAEALRELAASVSLGLISDTAYSPGRRLREVLRHHGVLDLFRCLMFSDEVGASKPHPKIFSAALGCLDADPAYSLHIGDIERTDISGAKAAGMRAILFRGDATARYYDENAPEHSAADAVAHHWSEIPGIVRDWSGV